MPEKVMVNQTRKSSIAYDAALVMIKDSYKRGRILNHSLHSKNCISNYELLSILALPKSTRRNIVKKTIHSHDALNIITVGVLAWVLEKSLSEYDQKEKAALEDFFTRYEEYFDEMITPGGLFPAGQELSWPPEALRSGFLIELQALYVRVLSVLCELTNDDMYAFKKRRFLRTLRQKLHGGYILDRENSLEVRPNTFLAAFFAPELFNRKEWEKTFDAFLKTKNLWLPWGGINDLATSDEKYDSGKNGSWFFVNNIVAIVLASVNSVKYGMFIDKIFQASTDNISWQDHAGMPCEVVVTGKGRLKNAGHFSLSLSTYIYLYRTLNPNKSKKAS